MIFSSTCLKLQVRVPRAQIYIDDNDYRFINWSKAINDIKVNLTDYRLKAFQKASLCRHFENQVYKFSKNKIIKYPVYLSAGQEYIASSLAAIYEEFSVEPDIFIQHRGHSTYLAFGDVNLLIKELLGHKDGCANGMGGSASIQSKEKIFMDMTG